MENNNYKDLRSEKTDHKQFWIEFEVWKIEAESREHAHEIVKQRFIQGEHPRISYIEQNDMEPLRLNDSLKGLSNGSK